MPAEGVLEESGCFEYTVQYNLTRAGAYTHSVTVRGFVEGVAGSQRRQVLSLLARDVAKGTSH
jgi:hypothetical protein